MLTVYLGNLEHFNRYRLDDKKSEYYPYVKEGSNLYKMLKETFKLKEPLLRDSHLVVIEEEGKKSYKEFGENIKILVKKDLLNPHIDYLYVVSPKDTYGQIPSFNNMELIDLRKTRYDDFKLLIEKEFNLPKDNKVVPLLIKKIGYSEENYVIYRELLLERQQYQGYISELDVKDLIPERLLPAVDEILIGLINTKKKHIKNHYYLCEKYSKSWVLDYYKDTLKKTLQIQKQILENYDKLITLRRNRETFRYVKILEKTGNILNLYKLYLLLDDNKKHNFSVEYYLIEKRLHKEKN